MSKQIEKPNIHDRVENFDILNEINKIQSERTLYKYEEIKLIHQEFAEQNPELFEKCVREKISQDDIKNTIYLLDLRQQVKDGKITYEKASSIMSFYMAKKFQPELLQKDGFQKKRKK